MTPLRIALLAALLGLVPTSADAMSPPIGKPSRISVLEGATDVVLVEVHTVVRCAAIDDCTFEARHVVESAERRAIALVADGHRVAGLELSVGGVNVLGSNVIRENDRSRELPAVTRTTRRFETELPDGRTTIMLTGAMRPRDAEDAFGVEVSLPIRHPVLAQNPGWQRREFLLDLGTMASWGGTPRATFAVEFADDLDLRSTPDPGVVEAGVAQVSIQAAWRRSSIVHGGPYVGVGGILDEPGGWFGRLGYEVGFGLWTVFGLAVETDFSTRVVVAPTVQGASAGFSCIFPSFGLGAGPALRLGDVTTFGGRALFDVQLPFIGLVGTLDWYPGLDSPDRIDFALAGRLSF